MIKKMCMFVLIFIFTMIGIFWPANVVYGYTNNGETEPNFELVKEDEETFLSLEDYPKQFKYSDENIENSDVEPYSWWQYVYDQYEYNDNFYKATFIDTLGSFSFNRTIRGTLHKYPFWYVTEWGDTKDQDFYRIIVPSDSKFSISLYNIPTNCNFELELYKLNDTKLNSGGGSVEILMEEAYDLIGESKNGGNFSESISVAVQAGEYVVKVFSVSGTSDDDFYSLNLKTETEELHTYKNISINELKELGHKMAVWQSDFYPLGKSVLELQENGDIGPYWKNQDVVGDASVYSTIYQKLKDENPNHLLSSAVYVWDPLIKQELRDLYAGIYSSLVQIKQKGYNEVSITLEIVSTGTGVASLAVDFSLHPAVGFTLGLISFVTSVVVNYVMPIEYEINIDEALPYYAAYMNALEVGPNGIPDEVVCVKNYFRVSEFRKNWISEKRLVIDSTPRYYGTNSKVPSNSILSWKGPENTDGEYISLFGGQIYGVSTLEEMNHIITSPKKHSGPLNMPDPHQHHFKYIGGLDYHYLMCECGKIDTDCFLEPTINNYSYDYHVYKCHGFQKLEQHKKYFDGKDHYRCLSSGCNWNQLVLVESISENDYDYESQYYFIEKTKNISTSQGSNIFTKRLRAGIVDNKLVLSAKRKNAGLAYIEYYFDYNINRVNYDLSLWSENESLILNSSIRFEAQDNRGNWITMREFDAKLMSKNKELPINYYSEITFPSKAFRFIVETNEVQNENNRGRVVIGNIDILRTHSHNYNLHYISKGELGHISSCSCGATRIDAHVISINQSSDRYANCLRCNYLIDLWYGGPVIVEPFNISYLNLRNYLYTNVKERVIHDQ